MSDNMKSDSDIVKESEIIFEKALNEDYSQEETQLLSQLESTSKLIMSMISLPKESPKYEKALNGIKSIIIKLFAIENSIENLKTLSALFQKKINKMKIAIKKSMPHHFNVISLTISETIRINNKETIVLFEKLSSDIQNNLMNNLVYILIISAQTKTIDIIINYLITELPLSFEQIDYLLTQYKPLSIYSIITEEEKKIDMRNYLINTSDVTHDAITQGINYISLFKQLYQYETKLKILINNTEQECNLNITQCNTLNEIIQSFLKIITQSQCQTIKTSNESELKQIFTY